MEEFQSEPTLPSTSKTSSARKKGNKNKGSPSASLIKRSKSLDKSLHLRDHEKSLLRNQRSRSSSSTTSTTDDPLQGIPTHPEGIGIGGPLSSSPLSTAEENLLLKRHLRKQEEKIKLLANTLVRIVNERRGKEKKDEHLIEEQKARIKELEHQNQVQREKLIIAREQLQSYTKLMPYLNTVKGSKPSSSTATFSFPGAKSYTSLRSAPSISKTNANKKSALGSKRPSSTTSTVYGAGGGGGTKSPKPIQTLLKPKTKATRAPQQQNLNVLLEQEFTSRVEQLLLEAKGENLALEEQLRTLRDELDENTEKWKEKLHEKDVIHQEDLLRVREQLELEVDRCSKKRELSDNIELMRLQRDNRKTAAWLSTVETQCRSLEVQLNMAHETIAGLENDVTSLQDELREGSQKALTLQKDLEDSSAQLNRLKEVETELKALHEENSILKQANDNFLEKKLSSATLLRDRKPSVPSILPATEVEQELRELKIKYSRLETELGMKSRVENELNNERRRTRDLESRIKILEEDIKSLRAYKDSNPPAHLSRTNSKSPTSFSKSKSHAEELERVENELRLAQCQLIEVRDELQKTRALLKTQMTINSDCQREIELLTGKLDAAESGHGEKLREFMTLLEQRTNQMTRLERTLESLSRGDRPTTTNTTTGSLSTTKISPPEEYQDKSQT